MATFREGCEPGYEEGLKELRPRWEMFARMLAEGYSKEEAFLQVSPKSSAWKPSLLSRHAKELSARPEIRARVARLMFLIRSTRTASIQEVQETLSAAMRVCAKNNDIENLCRVTAILSKVCGYDAPKKILSLSATVDASSRNVSNMSDEELMKIIDVSRKKEKGK